MSESPHIFIFMRARVYRKRFKCKVCRRRSTFVFDMAYSVCANGVLSSWIRVCCPKCFHFGVFVWHPRRVK